MDMNGVLVWRQILRIELYVRALFPGG